MRHLYFGILLTSLLGGCGGALPLVSDHPADASGASRMVLGTWNVYTHEGELDGTMTFMNDEVQVLAGSSWFQGTWSLQTASAGRFGLELTFSGVEVEGERQVWTESLLVSLNVVFSGRDEVLALQPDGRWTRWERLAGAAE